MADDDQNAADDAMAEEYADDMAMNEDGEQRVCKVYDHEDFFTVFVQILLAFFALMSLWFKRQGEKPRRKFRTWFLDVAKQGLGACYAHVCNMVIAAVIIDQIRGDGELTDQCAWYGMCYLVDTTLGLVLAIWCLKALDYVAHSRDWVSLKHSGVYEGVDGLLHWIHQVVAWMLVLTVVKVVIYYFMIWCSGFLALVGGVLFAPLQSNIRFELLFVMIFFPGFLNVIYFWIADSYLQANASHKGAHEHETEEVDGTEMTGSKQESLLTEEEKASENESQTETPDISLPWYQRWFRGAQQSAVTTIATSEIV